MATSLCRLLPRRCRKTKVFINLLEDLFATGFSDGDDLHAFEALSTLAEMLSKLAGQNASYKESVNDIVANRIKERLQSDLAAKIQMSDFESEHGMDRFSITRQFRRYFGTSPHRFLVMRRLELAKQAMLEGSSLADAAFTAGFADQSHMTRHFRRAFGIAPGQWLRFVSNKANH